MDFNRFLYIFDKKAGENHKWLTIEKRAILNNTLKNHLKYLMAQSLKYKNFYNEIKPQSECPEPSIKRSASVDNLTEREEELPISSDMHDSNRSSRTRSSKLTKRREEKRVTRSSTKKFESYSEATYSYLTRSKSRQLQLSKTESMNFKRGIRRSNTVS
jgi:hypothetical protein